ncbi:unnamed protein product [Aureobasidium pullulans]|nr:unnamed protein product [Aureobasidium pullulans]CAD0037673.1 unnamed protein product [Aureobasidium pullulans]
MDGQTIASTDRAYWVLETYHPPTYYLPPDSIKLNLTPTSRRTFCDFTTPGGEQVDSRAWTYKEPTPTFAEIKDYVSFYADPRWECYVDGELVEPQPGDFYGGWMTSDIVRKSVKGAPGTRGW